MKYNHLATGGTFDRLHRGHEAFLKHAFSKAEKVSIGISSDKLLADKELQSTIEPYEVRVQNLTHFLKRNNFQNRAHVFKLTDIYGVALGASVDSILVTSESKTNAVLINKKRKLQNLHPLKILQIPLIHGNDNKIIRSERIRAGEIDRNGYYLKKLFTKRLILPKSYRQNLRAPIGEIIQGKEDMLGIATQKAVKTIKNINPIMTIAVGDIIVNELIHAVFPADIEIIDFRTRRHILKKVEKKKGWRKPNKPGTINPRAVASIFSAIRIHMVNKKPHQIVISGEEDLLALPAILLAPVHSVVVYGQFDLGIIIVEVTEDKKEEVRKILSHFV